MQVSDAMAEAYRTNSKPKIKSNNRYTNNRRKMFDTITEQSGGDAGAALDYSLSIIKDNLSRIKQYVISQNEVPNDDLQQLAAQAYTLRCKQVEHTAKAMGIAENEAMIFIESDEAENDDSNNGESDNYLAELAAPIGVAGSAIIGKQINDGDADSLDPSLVSGILNTIGSKVNSADLKRAAQDKPPGILGFLGTGGTSAYNALRAYFKLPAHAAEKQAVIDGRITDIAQLSGYAAPVPSGTANPLGATGQQLLDNIANAKKKEMLQKALPWIIGGLLVVVLIIIFVARSQRKK